VFRSILRLPHRGDEAAWRGSELPFTQGEIAVRRSQADSRAGAA
jgi:hypothetical protein